MLTEKWGTATAICLSIANEINAFVEAEASTET
jgi:hypothetical protein